MLADVLQNLVRGRHRIEDGWCQQSTGLVNEFGVMGYCAIGAIAKVDKLVHHYSRGALRAAIGDEWKCIVHWNDAPGRKKEEVVLVFLEAINSVQTLISAGVEL